MSSSGKGSNTSGSASAACKSEPSKDLSSYQTMKAMETNRTPKEIIAVIDCLKQQVEANRCAYVKNKMEDNKQKLLRVTLSKERKSAIDDNCKGGVDLLLKSQNDAISMQVGIYASSGDKSSSSSQEDGISSSAVLIGSNIPVKSSVRPIKLPEVKRLPPYTTWMFLERNQRMADDQSVVGRRRIYYDQSGGEALICSDSEEEVIDEEDIKKEFAGSEDYILKRAIDRVGISDVALDLLSQCLSKKPCDIQARYEFLSKEPQTLTESKTVVSDESSANANPYLDKDLEGALDSFDNLFCRRCYVFDCRLHGCSQDLIFPIEKPLPWCPPDQANAPCSMDCYRVAMKSEHGHVPSSKVKSGTDEKPDPSCKGSSASVSVRKKSTGPSTRRCTKSNQSESASSNAKKTLESSDSDEKPERDDNSINRSSSPSKNRLMEKSLVQKKKSKRVAERILIAMRKKQKNSIASEIDSFASGGLSPGITKAGSDMDVQDEDTSSSSLNKAKSPADAMMRMKDSVLVDSKDKVPTSLPCTITDDKYAGSHVDSERKEEFVDESSGKQKASHDHSWKTLEKSLYEKGMEIFGRNSCLIARNLLNGLKTCLDVYQYMNHLDNPLSCQVGDGSTKADNELMGVEGRRRSRFVRRRGRIRRLKYSWKVASYHSIRKRISEKKDQPCRQYNPCGCDSACGKQCPCLLNGTCCEKYCGCPKICKNRFRGCHCAKSQCRSRQCPCFAANRECDPDVCRNCWVSCGDGTLGVPNQRGDNYECRNMKLLLKQQQRVLLGRSDVSGWGAFLKNSVAKHEYLGEYTGELISHREADKRGKIYDRENSSFLFNLNDQFVLDAFRKGDKLKFANHSPDPNCYAKVLMVAGDHRVGIFAKERINAGEELFYDYRYEPDSAPAWARKLEASGSRRDDAAPSGRAKKLA
ncbi:hypothetical protein Droror1_Dr00010732 [Drosera rotundifolia]